MSTRHPDPLRSTSDRPASSRPGRTDGPGPVTWTLRLLGVLASLGITVGILVAYPGLPDIIPTHIGVSGAADDWGPKLSILVLAGVMLALSIGLALLSARPRIFNYPIPVTEDNAQAVYREGERMMVWVLLALQAIYLGLAVSVVNAGGGAVIAIGAVAMVGAVVLGIIRLLRAAR